MNHVATLHVGHWTRALSGATPGAVWVVVRVMREGADDAVAFWNCVQGNVVGALVTTEAACSPSPLESGDPPASPKFNDFALDALEGEVVRRETAMRRYPLASNL